MQKLLVFLVAIAANLVFVWYGYKTGKIGDTGQIFSWKYDSRIISSTIAVLKYIWILIIANAAYTWVAKSGIESFGSFLPFILIWIAAAPVAALLFNAFVGKEAVNLYHILGILFIFVGGVLIAANKEILNLIQK